jgi:hypothetical protein
LTFTLRYRRNEEGAQALFACATKRMMNVPKFYNFNWRWFLPLLVFLGAALVVAPFKSRSKGPWLALTRAQAEGKEHNAHSSSAHQAVLVELFTSEGCSSCPPADALLGHLRQDLGRDSIEVIPLGFHVDYWNSLGWKDRFSSPEFSRRQEQYAHSLSTEGPYTPQMIVDGETEFVGSDAARARETITDVAGHAPQAEIRIVPSENSLAVQATTVSGTSGDVLLAITEDNLSTKVGAGENNGRELRHAAVVRELRRLGKIDSGAFNATVPLKLPTEWKRDDLRAVVFVQQGEAGKVLGAASVPLLAAPAGSAR